MFYPHVVKPKNLRTSDKYNNLEFASIALQSFKKLRAECFFNVLNIFEVRVLSKLYFYKLANENTAFFDKYYYPHID